MLPVVAGIPDPAVRPRMLDDRGRTNHGFPTSMFGHVEHVKASVPEHVVRVLISTWDIKKMFGCGGLAFGEVIELVPQLNNFVHSPMRVGWFQHTIVINPDLCKQTLELWVQECLT